MKIILFDFIFFWSFLFPLLPLAMDEMKERYDEAARLSENAVSHHRLNNHQAALLLYFEAVQVSNLLASVFFISS